MQLIFLVIKVILALAIIGAVLLQKNGGNGLGSLGGSGSAISGGNIISGRASASFLTRATAVLMACFMINSLILGNLSVRQYKPKNIIEQSVSKIDINEKSDTKALEQSEPDQVPVSE